MSDNFFTRGFLKTNSRIIKALNKVFDFLELATRPKVLFLLIFFLLVFMWTIMAVMMSKTDEENMKKCLQNNPDWTYEECESAVVW